VGFDVTDQMLIRYFASDNGVKIGGECDSRRWR